MNRSLLSIAGILCAGLAFGQTSPYPKVPVSNSKAAPYDKQYRVGDEFVPQSQTRSSRQNSQNGRVIGTTTYDLQTNSASQNRLAVHSDGTVTAVWTYSSTNDLAAADRGTGYNYFDGSGWGSNPSSRIETQRGGWPSILPVNGGEFNSLHNTTSAVVTSNRRSTKGTGSWTESNVSSTDLIWNRTAVGGPNGNTIHMIAVTAPTANNGTLFQGLDGALVYYRSQDGGATWDIQDSVLPGMTAAEFTGFSGDAYTITARGNTVAIVSFGEWADAFMMKSTDNGDTWTKTIINDFPIDLWVADQGSDYNNDGINDTLYTTDGAGAVVLDTNGSAHVFFGLMRVLDEDLTDGQSTYFPYTNGLMYWNEGMGTGTTTDDFTTMSAEIIAQAEDLNDDGLVQDVTGSEQEIARYFVSLAGIPSASYNPNTGVIYVGYQSYMETLSNGAQNYRHIYVTNSSDGGCTWSVPSDVTDNGAGFEECVFVSLGSTVDDSVRLIYQEDNEPGLAVRGDEDGYVTNEIVYISLPTDSFPSSFTNEVSLSSPSGCDGEDLILTAVSSGAGVTYLWSNGATDRTITLNSTSETGTYSVTVYSPCGDTLVSDDVDVTIYPAAQTPTVTYNGDGTYTASGSNIASYQWYLNNILVNGSTSATFDASSNPGATIKVEITDANGCSTQSADVVVGIDAIDPVIGRVSVFPNPTQERVTVAFNGTQEGTYNVQLMSIVGQEVFTTTVSVNDTHFEEIDLSGINPGVYQVRVSNGENQLTQRLVVR